MKVLQERYAKRSEHLLDTRRIPKILLVYPEYPETFWSFKYALKFVSKKAVFPPLGLLTVAALLPEHWEKRLADMNVEILKDKDLAWADYVMISAMSSTMGGAMIIGIFIFQVPLVLSAGSLATATVGVIMMMASHIGIGFAAAGAILVLKRGEPIVFMFSVFTQFFSGVLYPLNVVPQALLPIAYFLIRGRSLNYRLLFYVPWFHPLFGIFSPLRLMRKSKVSQASYSSAGARFSAYRFFCASFS
jgi:hypothetical protein